MDENQYLERIYTWGDAVLRVVRAMHKWPYLLALVVIACEASAANHFNQVSVDEFEKTLAAARGQSDSKVAHRISEMELTERASSVRLARWEAEFPGHHCREALTELADNSAFLQLPASEIPGLRAPDIKAQRAMLEKMSNYAVRTLKRLPNFSATRVTHHFEDTPVRVDAEGFVRVRTHSTGVSSTTVTYRDGHELSGSTQTDVISTPAKTMTTTGEFGPVLGIVLGDASQGTVAWSHWEQGQTGVEAVFRYSVPLEHAHYAVSLPREGRVNLFLPAYHGEIAIDPTKGDIMRISVIAELAPPNDRVTMAIAVDYGTVLIGDKPYTCPVKSVAVSRIPANDKMGAAAPIELQLNDVTFTGYHLFRAETRILTGAAVESGEGAAAEGAPSK